jgi:hypothetical protein
MRRSGLVLRGILVTILGCAFGPLMPWLTVSRGLATWDAGKDVWELYDLRTDFSQAKDLTSKDPKRLARMEALSLKKAKENKVFAVGAGIVDAHSSGRPMWESTSARRYRSSTPSDARSPSAARSGRFRSN